MLDSDKALIASWNELTVSTFTREFADVELAPGEVAGEGVCFFGAQPERIKMNPRQSARFCSRRVRIFDSRASGGQSISMLIIKIN